jgi:hypothetical protein
MEQPKKQPKAKKLKKDTIYNPERKSPFLSFFIFNVIVHDNETPEEIQQRIERKRKNIYFLNDLKILSTLGTGTFGRVRLVKHRNDGTETEPLALKCLKKSAIIKLKQIDHVKSEKKVLSIIDHPFIVNLKGHF